MKIHKGQTLIEFLLIFTVLLITISGVFVIYKKFWKRKYERVSAPSTIAVSSLKTSESVSYVR
ncbi:MAG: hypothetical protein LBT18_05320 [Endomicrobium sp.]|jgi:uncharacterized protein (UPF0333 family)|nr:hypothetical protein [Endomicrobium sp.]